MADEPEYITSHLVDLGAIDLTAISSLDADLLTAALAHVLGRLRRPGETMVGFTKGGPRLLSKRDDGRKPSDDGI
jgi:hypothetical protein